MNRDCRDKAIADTEFAYYESIARLIADNPTVTLSEGALIPADSTTLFGAGRASRSFPHRSRTITEL
jgi:hypothetical protein